MLKKKILEDKNTSFFINGLIEKKDLKFLILYGQNIFD